MPLLADRVAAALRKRGVHPGSVAGSTSVAEVGDTDVLEFTTANGSPTLAAQVATEYARQFTLYHQQLDTSSITTAIKGLQRRIAELRLQGGAQSAKQITVLQGKVDQLRTLLSLQTSSAVVVRTASGAAKIRPRPTKYGLLGLGLGLVLGIGLALLRGRLRHTSPHARPDQRRAEAAAARAGAAADPPASSATAGWR